MQHRCRYALVCRGCRDFEDPEPDAIVVAAGGRASLDEEAMVFGISAMTGTMNRVPCVQTDPAGERRANILGIFRRHVVGLTWRFTVRSNHHTETSNE